MKKTLLLLASLFLICSCLYSQDTVFQMPFVDSSNWEFRYELFPPLNESEPPEAYTEIVNNTLHMFCYQASGAAKSWNNYKTINNFLPPDINYQMKISFTMSWVELGTLTYSLSDRKVTIPYDINNHFFETNGLDLIIQVKDSVRVFKQLPSGMTKLDFTEERIAPSDSFKLEFYLFATGPGDLYHLVEAFIDTIEITTLPYQSVFGTTSTSWNLFHEIPDAHLTDSLVVSKDTTIHDLVYKEVIKTPLGYERYYLRESDDRSKVYLYLPDIGDEKFPVMDLTLALADTFYVGTDRSDTLLVDSVYTSDGLKHIRFNYPIEFTGGTEKLEFIEGTGTNFGLFYQGIESAMIPMKNYLLCAYQNGSHVYSNKSMNGQCRVFWTGIDDQTAAGEIKMYPNPAKDKLTIELPENLFTGTCQLQVFNSSGMLVETREGNSNPITVNVQDKPAGIYLIRLNLNSKYYNLRFVVSK